MNIYLDNEKKNVPGDWHHCTNVSETISLLMQSPGSTISIDYDNGIIFLKWLYAQLKSNIHFVSPNVYIHIIDKLKQKELLNLIWNCFEQECRNNQIKTNYYDSLFMLSMNVILLIAACIICITFLPTPTIIILLGISYLHLKTYYDRWIKMYRQIHKEVFNVPNPQTY